MKLGNRGKSDWQKIEMLQLNELLFSFPEDTAAKNQML